MQCTIICLFVLCCVGVASAQQHDRKPLILQGKLKNSPEKFLTISLYNEKDEVVFDTLYLNNQGEFFLKTYKITRPQRTDLRQNRTQIGRLYVAPGYNLHITGDATNNSTLFKSKKISGIGAETNHYRIQRDSVYAAANDKRPWFERKPEEVMPYFKAEQSISDSIHHSVFDRAQSKDPYFSFFKKMIDIDNQSETFTSTLQFAMNNNYTMEQMRAVVDSNIPPLFAKGISNDDYLIAEDYTRWLLPVYYEYSKKLTELGDTVAAQQPDFPLKLINRLFTRKVRASILHYTVKSQFATRFLLKR